jgi:hypothetical protein
MDERPNITTVGAVGGVSLGVPVASLLVWVWNGWGAPAGLPEMGPEPAAQLGVLVTVVLTLLVQRRDRARKRLAGHVVGKYLDQLPGHPPPEDVERQGGPPRA